jgi:hypothetical protein
MGDFSKYVAMRDHGVYTEEVFRQARHNGLDTVTCLRICAWYDRSCTCH